jgi:hypothetical protein
VHYPEDNMPFALPLIESAASAEHLKIPDLDTRPLKAILDHAQLLYDRSGQSALLRLPDVQTPMDIAALILEKKCFYTALVECPEVVLEVAHKVQVLQSQFFDEWFRRFGSAFISHYPDYYMPYGITVSEDEVGAISSRMYECSSDRNCTQWQNGMERLASTAVLMLNTNGIIFPLSRTWSYSTLCSP